MRNWQLVAVALLLALAVYAIFQALPRAQAQPVEECPALADYLVAVEQDQAETLFHERGAPATALLVALSRWAPVGQHIASADEAAVFYIPGDRWAYMLVLQDDCIEDALKMPASLPMYVLLRM